jgi:hypothetical protein
MDRRTLIISSLVTLGATSLAQAQPIGAPSSLPPAGPANGAPPANAMPEGPPPPDHNAAYPASGKAETYSRDEIVNNVSDFMGVTAEAAGGAVEKIFQKNGSPTAYIAGEEGSGAFVAGARYGRGLLYMKGKDPVEVFWRGPSVGWDFGGNASRVFTLCYNLDDPRLIFQRYPGVEGSAYFIGGLGVNYQQTENIVLAPIRAGVGFRLGANVGYLAYSRTRNLFPF